MIGRTSVLLGVLAIGHPDAYADSDIEWRYQSHSDNVTVMANRLGRGSRMAFYEARGFSVDTIRPYAEACGFSFGMKNEGGTSINARLADWRAIGTDGRAVAFVAPETWEERWRKAGVSSPARIAFRWAQFQSDNVFAPGDWIMGMATLTVKPAGLFRLVARYSDDKGNHEIVLDKLECARD
jgi:hypothetical protein